MAARIVGVSPIIAIDRLPARLDSPASSARPTRSTRARTTPVEVIMGLTGVGVDYAVEASGAPVALRQAIDALGPGGTCALVGAPPGGVEVRST